MGETRISDWSRSITVASWPPVSGGMTVWALRAMVRALDEAGIGDSERVDCEHDDATGHLVRLRVRQIETRPEPASDGGGDDAP